MTLLPRANTTAQAEGLKKLDAWSRRSGVSLRFAGGIGKSPQSVLVDVKHQDGLFYISAKDGRVLADGDDDREVETFDDFVDIIKSTYPDMVVNEKGPEVVLRFRIDTDDASGLKEKVESLIEHGTVREAFNEAGMTLQDWSVEVVE